MIIKTSLVIFLNIQVIHFIGHVLMNAKIQRCLVPGFLPPTEETGIIHTSACRDSSALFRILDSGAIQHVQSGLCIHLSGNRECPNKGEVAILKRGKFCV